MNARPFSRPGSFLLAAVLVAGLACASCASVPAAPEDTRIVIFHSNDIHGKIDNFAKVAAIIAREKQGGADVYYFCAGDNFTGNPIIDQYEPPGEPMLELLNRLGLDLLCPGNHEFDIGLENLKRSPPAPASPSSRPTSSRRRACCRSCGRRWCCAPAAASGSPSSA